MSSDPMCQYDSTIMQAEQEWELATMEQCHAHTNPPSGTGGCNLSPPDTQGHNTHVTLLLDAIRHTKKLHSTSYQTWLIGVTLEVSVTLGPGRVERRLES